MRSPIACMALGMANCALHDDGNCWETVLRFLQTPSPADYSFEFGPTRLITEESEEQDFEENLVVDEYLFKPFCISKQIIYNKAQKQEQKPTAEVQKQEEKATAEVQKPERKQTAEVKRDVKIVNPGKFLKLAEGEMVQSLRRWKHHPSAHETIVHPVTIKEADVYALHPADLIFGASTHYFYSATKYSCLKRPTRLRITENGCRWKQQGRRFPIRDNGLTVAFKTYLSHVPLKSGSSVPKKLAAPDIEGSASNSDVSGKKRDRKWSLWTMEEIALAEDIQSEKVALRGGVTPRPFPVICRIFCKSDGDSPAPSQTRLENKRAVRRASPVESKNFDIDARSLGNTTFIKTMETAGHVKTKSSLTAGNSASSGPQNFLEDEIIQALVYDLPYGKVRFG